MGSETWSGCSSPLISSGAVGAQKPDVRYLVPPAKTRAPGSPIKHKPQVRNLLAPAADAEPNQESSEAGNHLKPEVLSKAGWGRQGLCPQHELPGSGWGEEPLEQALPPLITHRFFGWITVWHFWCFPAKFGLFCAFGALHSSSTADTTVSCVESEQGQMALNTRKRGCQTLIPPREPVLYQLKMSSYKQIMVTLKNTLFSLNSWYLTTWRLKNGLLWA